MTAVGADHPTVAPCRGDVWSTVGGGLLVVLRVDELAALTTVTGAALSIRRPEVGPPLRIPVGTGRHAAWVKTNLVVTVPRAELARRHGRLGPVSMSAVADGLAAVLGLGGSGTVSSSETAPRVP